MKTELELGLPIEFKNIIADVNEKMSKYNPEGKNESKHKQTCAKNRKKRKYKRK